MRIAIAVLLLTSGIVNVPWSLTFLPCLLYPSISWPIIASFVAMPIAMALTGLALILKSRWESYLLVASLLGNLVAGYSFLPGLNILALWVIDLPLVPIAIIQIPNLCLLLVVVFTQTQPGKLPGSEVPSAPSVLATLRLTMRYGGLAMMVGSVVLWLVTFAIPIETAGGAVRPWLMQARLDIINVKHGRLYWRTADLRYSFWEPFQIEVLWGDLSSERDSDHFGALQRQFTFLGFVVGAERQIIPYRVAIVTDVAVPLWFTTILGGLLFAATLLARPPSTNSKSDGISQSRAEAVPKDSGLPLLREQIC